MELSPFMDPSMTSWFFDPQLWASLLTLTILEIVLGIDNLIFISITAGKLPAAERHRAQRVGLMLALLTRLLLLASIVWISHLSTPLFTFQDFTVSWRDIVLFLGGLFLIAKGTLEIHDTVEGKDGEASGKGTAKFLGVVIQIMILDIVFSLDSVITAVGLTDNLPVMMTAVVAAMLVMLFAATPTSEFIKRHPTAKMLALSFLLLVGTALVADGLHFHVPRNYLYFAIAFSIAVEALNLTARKKQAARQNNGDAS
jgi:predicted tellurium resistance membrane protein TerC